MRKICREAVAQGHVWEFDTVLGVLSGKNASLFYLGSSQSEDWDGYILVRQVDLVCELFFVYVSAGARRRGIATRLLESVREMLAKLNQQTEFFLEVRTDNEEAQALYEKFGFSQIGRRKMYYRDGTDALTYKMIVNGAAS